MFFPERINNILPNDFVLEVGPGATPYSRSNVFLEKDYTEEELIAQSGHIGIIQTKKKIVYYNGGKFPFKDKEFDYVICSHVIEHVLDLPFFIKEIFRVGNKGYFEFPSIYYDYLYNIPEHINCLQFRNNNLYWIKKENTPINSLNEFTYYFRQSLIKGYKINNKINNSMFVGFEWDSPFEIINIKNWKDICYSQDEININLPSLHNKKKKLPLGVKYHFKELFKALLRKFKNMIIHKAKN